MKDWGLVLPVLWLWANSFSPRLFPQLYDGKETPSSQVAVEAWSQVTLMALTGTSLTWTSAGLCA